MEDTKSTPELEKIWESMTEMMLEESLITQTSYDLWFSNFKLRSLTAKKAVFAIENEFKSNIIMDKYFTMLDECLKKTIGFAPDEIVISVDTSLAPPIEGAQPYFKYGRDENGRPIVISDSEEENDDAEEVEQSFFSTDENRRFYNPDYTFDNFIVGPSNALANAAAHAVASDPGGAMYNPLFIYGPSGVGKTHLMYAITNEILERRPHCKIVYVKGEEFTNQLIESLSTKSQQVFREKYRKADVLLIDDVQFIAGKVSTQEEFFHTFNALYEDHKQIILTSDRPPKDMATLEERIRTRFESGVITDIQAPDFELRLAILRNKAEQVNLDIPLDVLDYLAQCLNDNVRKIEGAIKRLSAHALLTGKPITMDMARAQIETYRPQTETPQEIANNVIKATARKYNVSIEDMLGEKRTKEIKTARNASMYIIKQMTPLSLNEIGKLLRRDHATVHSNIKAITEEIKSNSYLENEINDIIAEVK